MTKLDKSQTVLEILEYGELNVKVENESSTTTL